LTYSLGATADDTHFAVDSASGQLKTKGALDYESEDEYTLTVTATDGDGLSASIAVTIRVTDVDETPANRAPVFAAASVVLSVAENTAAGTTIGDAVAATDPDGDALTYSLGATADDTHFAIDSASGQLKTKGALDYESEDEYTLTVTATDGDGLSASIAVTIRVTDVDETPPGKPDAPTFSKVQEAKFRVSWKKPNAGSSGITGYELQYKMSSEGADAWAEVKPAPDGTKKGYTLRNRDGQSVVGEMSYDVRVRAKNDEGWGEWSDAGTVTTADPRPPRDPSDDGGTETDYEANGIMGGGRVYIRWDAVEGAYRYIVLRNGVQQPGYIVDTYLFDSDVSQGETYRYVIRAVDRQNNLLAEMEAIIRVGGAG
jgi:hypothetical protein